MWLNMDYWPLILYDVAMTNTSEFLTKSPHSLISAAAKSAFVPTSRSVVAANRGSGSVTAALELAKNPALDARCLWCDRAFSPRTTGGSPQKFCGTGHRQQFLDRGASLDNEGDRGGPALGRLLEGVSHERARCLRRHSDLTDIPDS